MDLPFLIYKGVFEMKKNFLKMTSKQKAELAKRYGHLIEDNCSNQECESCPFFHERYTNLPEEVFRGRRLVCSNIYEMFAREVGKE